MTRTSCTGQYVFVMLERVCAGLGALIVVVAVLAGVLAGPVPRASAHVDKRAQGAELFASTGCAHCHGNNGEGTDRAPALRDLRKKLSVDRTRDQIVHGGQGMPAFGDSLKPGEVDDLIHFLRAKKWVPAAPKPAPAPAPQAP